jgi:hypothetical protein
VHWLGAGEPKALVLSLMRDYRVLKNFSRYRFAGRVSSNPLTQWFICSILVATLTSLGALVSAQAYKEITQWEDGATAINHTYLLDGDSMIAYMRVGTSVPFYFKAPIRISRSGRKFEVVDPNPFEHVPEVVVEQTTSDNTVEIEGSKGARYILDRVLCTCTCPGFTYRGTCKHVKELETE